MGPVSHHLSRIHTQQLAPRVQPVCAQIQGEHPQRCWLSVTEETPANPVCGDHWVSVTEVCSRGQCCAVRRSTIVTEPTKGLSLFLALLAGEPPNRLSSFLFINNINIVAAHTHTYAWMQYAELFVIPNNQPGLFLLSESENKSAHVCFTNEVWKEPIIQFEDKLPVFWKQWRTSRLLSDVMTVESFHIILLQRVELWFMHISSGAFAGL